LYIRLLHCNGCSRYSIFHSNNGGIGFLGNGWTFRTFGEYTVKYSTIFMRTTASITDMPIPTQRHVKHVSAAANKDTIIEGLLEVVIRDTRQISIQTKISPNSAAENMAQKRGRKSEIERLNLCAVH
jgi:hypothetical protein